MNRYLPNWEEWYHPFWEASSFVSANKHARQIWAMLCRDEAYDRFAALRHPLAGVEAV